MGARGLQEMWMRQRPEVLEALCESYQRARAVEQFPVLPLIDSCVFDLLCIRPFRDGNGRVSRLLTTFLLLQEGFSVCRHISLESLVEDRKEEYYSTLAQCSTGWREGRNDIDLWWNYFLSIVRQAYGDFAQKVENASGRPTKSDLVRRAIMDQVGSSLFPRSSPRSLRRARNSSKKSSCP
jgi:Fic family protein